MPRPVKFFVLFAAFALSLEGVRQARQKISEQNRNPPVVCVAVCLEDLLQVSDDISLVAAALESLGLQYFIAQAPRSQPPFLPSAFDLPKFSQVLKKRGWQEIPELQDASSASKYFFWQAFHPRQTSQWQLAAERLTALQNVTWIVFEGQQAFLRRHAEFKTVPWIKAHTIYDEDRPRFSADALSARWLRSVEERSCRFLLWRWTPSKNLDQNVELLRGVLLRLPSRHFSIGKVTAEKPPERPYLKARMILAWLLALTAPALAWTASSVFRNFFLRWLSSSWVCIGLGSGVFLLLPDSGFATGVLALRGIKFLMLGSWFLAAAQIFSTADFSDFWKQKIASRKIIFLAILIGVLALALLRSGSSMLPVLQSEHNFRAWLENFFGVRPRFKEFLWGQPLLLWGFFSLEKNSNNIIGKTAVLFGLLAWISILNSFCHLHTPLYLSLWRSFWGLCLGGVLGSMLLSLRVYRK